MSQAFDWDFDSLPPEHPLRQGSVEGPRSATDLSRLAPLPPVVGRYEVLERLGQGGMATVYRARETTSGHEVALKVMLPGGKVERMLREGRVAQRLRHAGILPVYDVGEVGGRPFLVYRLVPGARTLEDVLPGVGLRRGVELIRDVAAALAHAHRQGVVHRDVKFENVLVDVDERVLVGDFGLGLPLDLGGERLTRSGAVLGTPLFMAPELLEGDRDAQGPWTDVWSLGVMLYTLLSGGAYPHPGPGLLALLDQVRRERPSPQDLEVHQVQVDRVGVARGVVDLPDLGRVETGVLRGRRVPGDGAVDLVAIHVTNVTSPGPAYVENAPKDMVTALPGQMTEIRMTFDKPGVYKYVCKIHRKYDMNGVVIVENHE